MAKVKPVALPPSQIGKYEREPSPEHLDIIKTLKSKPGEWFPVRECVSQSSAGRFASNIRHSKLVAFRNDGGSFEATVRQTVVYARITS